MREFKYMAAIIVGLVVGVFIWPILLDKRAEQHQLVEDWTDLFNRCRTSIENAEPLNIERLEVLAFADPAIDYNFHNPHDDRARFLRHPNKRWLIVERESQNRTGDTRRSCYVQQATNQPYPNEIEQSLIVKKFLLIRYELASAVEDEQHPYRSIDPAPVFAISLGMRRWQYNANNCEVSVSLFISKGAPFFRTMIGEMSGNSDCGGSGRLGNEFNVR